MVRLVGLVLMRIGYTAVEDPPRAHPTGVTGEWAKSLVCVGGLVFRSPYTKDETLFFLSEGWLLIFWLFAEFSTCTTFWRSKSKKRHLYFNFLTFWSFSFGSWPGHGMAWRGLAWPGLVPAASQPDFFIFLRRSANQTLLTFQTFSTCAMFWRLKSKSQKSSLSQATAILPWSLPWRFPWSLPWWIPWWMIRILYYQWLVM